MSPRHESPAGMSRRGLLGRTAGAAAVLATGACAGPTQASSAGSDPDATLGLGITGLIVEDLQRSLAFYRVLGLDIPEQVDGADFRMRLPTGQVFFWDTVAATLDYDPGWQSSSGSRRVVLEFGFATPDAVDATYRKLVDAGYESYRGVDDLYGARYALVVDPDGNEIGLRHPVST